MAILEARGLCKHYQLGALSVEALAGVDFSVEAGEFVAIMGPSGSGKSTLLHLLGGLDQPSAGEIRLAGQPLSALTDDQATRARRRIGFVFQFFHLLPDLTAEENILLPVVIDHKDPRKYQARLATLLNLVGLAERRRHKPDQLSGGEKQRVALARALLTEPAVILADEPTGNLDTRTGMTIMELLRRSCDELHQTTIAVTHDARAAAYADRVVLLRDGCVLTEVNLDPHAPSHQRLRVVLDLVQGLER